MHQDWPEIRELKEQGHSINSIAKQLGLERHMVWNRLYQMGLTRDSGCFNLSQLIELFNKGYSDIKIGEMMGYNEYYIRNVRSLNGLRRPRGQKPTTNIEHVLKTTTATTQKEVAEQLGIHPNTVFWWCCKLGIQLGRCKKRPPKEELEKLVNLGWTQARIARHYGVSSPNLVRIWERKYGITHPKTNVLRAQQEWKKQQVKYSTGRRKRSEQRAI